MITNALVRVTAMTVMLMQVALIDQVASPAVVTLVTVEMASLVSVRTNLIFISFHLSLNLS